MIRGQDVDGRPWGTGQPRVPGHQRHAETAGSDHVQGICNRDVVAHRESPSVEIVLRTPTSDGVEVVLPALVYAKVLEEHPAVADLDVIDRTVLMPDARQPDVRPDRERFFGREAGLWVLVVIEFGEVPAIIVTVFAADHQPI